MSKSLDQFVKEQLSPHISSDFETFVAFLEAYYEWLSKESQPGGKLLNHQTNIDIDESLGSFAQDFIKTFSENFPTNTRLDSKKVAKQLRNIYTSKGSEQSFKLLFRILFSDEIDIKYPGNDVLIASGGDFRKETSIKVVSDPSRISTPYSFEQKTINFYDDESATPLSPVGFATVDRVTFFYEGSIPIYELFLSKGSIRGLIKPQLKAAIAGLDLLDDDTCICYVIPTTSEVSLVRDTLGNVIYSGEVNEGQIFEAKGQDDFFLVSTTAGSKTITIPQQQQLAINTAGDILGANSSTVLGGYNLNNPSDGINTPLYIGQEIAGANIQVGSFITSVTKSPSGAVTSFTLTNPATTSGIFSYTAESRGTYVIVRALDNDTGTPSKLDVLRYGINYYKDYEETLVLSEPFGGTKTIRVAFTSGAISNYQGTFKGNGGKLSDIVRIQDKSKYQKFAYVIQTGVSVNNWRNVVKELLNPAGFVFFGELALKNRINLSANITAANFTDIVRFFQDVCSLLDTKIKHVHKPRISTIDGVLSIRKQNAGADAINKPRISSQSTYESTRNKITYKVRESAQSSYVSNTLKNTSKAPESLYSAATSFILSRRINKQIIPNSVDRVDYYFAADQQYITPNNDAYVGPSLLTVITVFDTVSITKNGTVIQ